MALCLLGPEAGGWGSSIDQGRPRRGTDVIAHVAAIAASKRAPPMQAPIRVTCLAAWELSRGHLGPDGGGIVAVLAAVVPLTRHRSHLPTAAITHIARRTRELHTARKLSFPRDPSRPRRVQLAA